MLGLVNHISQVEMRRLLRLVECVFHALRAVPVDIGVCVWVPVGERVGADPNDWMCFVHLPQFGGADSAAPCFETPGEVCNGAEGAIGRVFV